MLLISTSNVPPKRFQNCGVYLAVTRRRYVPCLPTLYTPLFIYKNILGVANPLHGSFSLFTSLILLLSFVFVVLLSLFFLCSFIVVSFICSSPRVMCHALSFPRASLLSVLLLMSVLILVLVLVLVLVLLPFPVP